MTNDDLESVRLTLTIHPGTSVWVSGHNLQAKRAVEPLLAGTVRPPTGPVAVAFVAPSSADEAAYFLAKIEARLAPGGVAWVVLPVGDAADGPSVRAVETALAGPDKPGLRLESGAITLSGGFAAHPCRAS